MCVHSDYTPENVNLLPANRILTMRVYCVNLNIFIILFNFMVWFFLTLALFEYHIDGYIVKENNNIEIPTIYNKEYRKLDLLIFYFFYSYLEINGIKSIFRFFLRLRIFILWLLSFPYCLNIKVGNICFTTPCTLDMLHFTWVLCIFLFFLYPHFLLKYTVSFYLILSMVRCLYVSF